MRAQAAKNSDRTEISRSGYLSLWKVVDTRPIGHLLYIHCDPTQALMNLLDDLHFIVAHFDHLASDNSHVFLRILFQEFGPESFEGGFLAFEAGIAWLRRRLRLRCASLRTQGLVSFDRQDHRNPLSVGLNVDWLFDN